MILDKYGVRLNSEEREQLLHSFPGKEGGDDANKYGKRINIARIYDQKYNIILEQMYKRVDVAEAEAADEPTDVNGYLGQTKYYRTHIKQIPISQDEFVAVIHRDNKLENLMITIKQIDKDHNGYVTRTELDDILKMLYPNELANRDLIPIIKTFSSIQNKILIDYKSFMNWIKQGLKKLGLLDAQVEKRQQ